MEGGGGTINTAEEKKKSSRIEDKKKKNQLNKQTNMEAKRDNEETVNQLGAGQKNLLWPGLFHPMTLGNFQQAGALNTLFFGI